MKENENLENNNYDNEQSELKPNIDLEDIIKDDYKSELDSPVEKDLESFKEIQKIEKIVCPQCGKIPILEIDNKNYTIQSFCPNKHSIKEKLVNYIKNSNNKLEEISPESIECSLCKKNNKDLKIDKNDMYYCICKKYFCEDCKEKHEEEDDDEKNEEENDEIIHHNLIKYSEIEFQCECSKEFSDFICYCENCNINLCQSCQTEHRAKHGKHKIIYFSDEIDNNLTKEDLTQKNKEFKKQADTIKSFLQNLDDWKKTLDSKIVHLKENLKLLINVNEFILEKFDKSFMNHQTIKSIENLDFSYDKFINEFNGDLNIHNNDKDNVDAENINFEHGFGYLLGLLSYQKTIIFTKKENKPYKRKKIKNLNIIKNMPQIETKVESKITSLCQFEEDIIVGDEKGLVHLYKIGKKLDKILTINDNAGKEINYLYSLKNKYFISSNENGIKIIKIVKTKDMVQHHILQSFEYISYRLTLNDKGNMIEKINLNKSQESNARNIVPNTKEALKNNKIYYQIIELANNNVIYINKNKLMRLKPELNNNYNKKELSFEEAGNIISIAEINDNKFCAYSEGNKISFFDSNTFIKKGESIKLEIGNEEELKKIESINNSMFAGLGNNKLYIFSLCKGNDIKIIRTVDTQMNNIDLKIAVNPCKILIAGSHKNNTYINQYNFELTKDGITSSKNDTINLVNRINMIFLIGDNSNYAKLGYIHNNNFIKIYTNNNNNNNII